MPTEIGNARQAQGSLQDRMTGVAAFDISSVRYSSHLRYIITSRKRKYGHFLCVVGCPSISLIMLRKPSQQGDISPKFVILVSHKAVKRRPNTSS